MVKPVQGQDGQGDLVGSGEAPGPRAASPFLEIQKRRRQVRDLGSALQRHKGFLGPGVWVLDAGVACRDRGDVRRFVADRGLRWDVRRRGAVAAAARAAARRIFGLSRRVRVKEAGTAARDGPLAGFQGSVVLPRRLKTLIFDPEGKKVLLAFLTPWGYEGHTGRPALLSSCLGAPPVLAADPGRRIVLEPLVSGRFAADWDEEDREAAERFVWDRMQEYLEEARRHGPPVFAGETTCEALVDEVERVPAYRGLGERVRRRFGMDVVEGISFPVVHQHGDLKYENMVRLDDGFVVLDWELSRRTLFFHDLLIRVFQQAQYRGDTGPLRGYFAGGVDDRMDKAFRTVGAEFDPSARSAYLGLYFLNWLSGIHAAFGPDRLRRLARGYGALLERDDMRALLR